MSHLSQKLIKLRKSKGYTQTLIASKLNIPQKRYAAWEEERAEPHALMLITIADFYETTVDDLLRVAKEVKA